MTVVGSRLTIDKDAVWTQKQDSEMDRKDKTLIRKAHKAKDRALTAAAQTK